MSEKVDRSLSKFVRSRDVSENGPNINNRYYAILN